MSTAAESRRLARRSHLAPLTASGAAVATLATIYVFGCFLPYLAIPVGNNSNIALIVPLAVPLIILRPPSRTVVYVWLALITAPAVACFFTLLTTGTLLATPKTIALFVLWSSSLLVGGGLVRANTGGLIRIVTTVLAVSSLVAVLQARAIDRGSIPFLSSYDMPGYAPVTQVAQQILLYTKRPFGWYPEPSVLAGATCLAGVVLALGYTGEKSKRWQLLIWLSFAVGTTALVISESGEIAFGIPCLAATLLFSPSRARFVALRLTCLVVGAVAAVALLLSRISAGGWSWGDRSASIIATLDYALQRPSTAIFGVGTDASELLLVTGKTNADVLAVGFTPRGVYSVVGRHVVENGLLFGAGSIAFGLVVAVVVLSRVFSPFVAIAAVVLWLATATLTLSYDSLMFIWLTVGIFCGWPQQLAQDSAVDLGVEK